MERALHEGGELAAGRHRQPGVGKCEARLVGFERRSMHRPSLPLCWRVGKSKGGQVSGYAEGN